MAGSESLDQGAITAQYDRVAPFYRALSPLFLINPRLRRKAVAAMGLRAGDECSRWGSAAGATFPTCSTRSGRGAR